MFDIDEPGNSSNIKKKVYNDLLDFYVCVDCLKEIN